jgi:cell division protein FtsZ
MDNNMFGNLMNFDLPKDRPSIIKVAGVGGGGSNAVNHMYNQGIRGVDFMVCNTDEQALLASPVPLKIQLGADLTEGRGAGSIPEVGRNAAIENLDDVRSALSQHTKMLFITAGMGGGTGTGAAPIIAQAAREMGILTVGIVTMPFAFEGRKRREQAEKGLAELRKHVDTILVISNEKLREIYSDLSMSRAFAKADDVLSVAAKSIAEIITVSGLVNVDFADVRTVMTDGGNVIMGSAVASGEGRALRAVEEAMSSPLLDDNCIRGARHVLLHITYGTHDLGMDEMSEITDYVQDEAGLTADVIWGSGFDETLGDNICVTVVATGFVSKNELPEFPVNNPEKVVLNVEDASIPAPVQNSEVSFTEEPKIVFEQIDLNRENDLQEQKESQSAVEYFTLEVQGSNIPKTENPVQGLDLFVDEKSAEQPLFAPLAETPSISVETPDTFQPVTDTVPLASFETKLVPAEKEQTREELYRQNERMLRLKEISHKLKSPSGLKDLENEPAFARRNIKLEEHFDHGMISSSSISVDEDGVKVIRENRFLHGNVD